jgi:hypothetical protein
MFLSARVWNYCFVQRLLLQQLMKKYIRCGCLCSYVPEPDDTLVLDIAYQLYCKFEKYPDALRVALRMDNTQYVKSTFAACKDLLEKQQLCYILARQVNLCPQPLLFCGVFQPSTGKLCGSRKKDVAQRCCSGHLYEFNKLSLKFMVGFGDTQ